MVILCLSKSFHFHHLRQTYVNEPGHGHSCINEITQRNSVFRRGHRRTDFGVEMSTLALEKFYQALKDHDILIMNVRTSFS
jgi:hypothetical protein